MVQLSESDLTVQPTNREQYLEERLAKIEAQFQAFQDKVSEENLKRQTSEKGYNDLMYQSLLYLTYLVTDFYLIHN